MIEAWGRGIERMVVVCRVADTPVPEFECEQNGLWTELRFSPERMEVFTQEKILNLLTLYPSMTRNELAAHIGLTPDGIKYHLTKMKATGLIRRVGPTRSGHWEVLK